MIERSFRTDEEEFFFWLKQAPGDHRELNTWYQDFLETYNTIRPHRGINMLSPRKAIDLYHMLWTSTRPCSPFSSVVKS